MKKKLKRYLCNIAYTPYFDNIFQLLGGYKLYSQLRLCTEKKKLLADAIRQIEKGTGEGILSDYKNALDKHLISYNEYAYQYDFPHKSEKEREEFVTRLAIVYFYWRYVPNYTKPFFRNKHQFLKIFKKYIHRKWIYVPDASFEEFESLINNYDCIVKPCDDKRGTGIFKTYQNEKRNDDKAMFESCVKNKMLVEQCIESCDELKAFHPQSLNTIRVVTLSNKHEAEVFGAFFRVGVGNSIVDNAHAGGIFAQIDITNGKIESDGINTNGERFICHPDTGIHFKGFIIPKWNLIIETCCETAKLTDNTITGWDVAINSKGNVEFVEGNNGPDFDVMQSPLQIGVKKKLFSLIKKYRGIDMNNL